MSSPLNSPSSAPSAPSAPSGGVKPPSLGQSAPSTPAKDSVSNEALAAGVLIVDEDASFRLGLQTFLKEFVGFENIYSVANGLEALECLRENDGIEIVTLDQDMPEMDGLTFLRIVKDGDFPSLAAVMITGDPDASIEEKFRSLNSEGLVTEHFLEKPVDFNDLEAVILSSHNSLKKRQKDSAANTTVAAVAGFAGGAGVATALAQGKEQGDGEKESTNTQIIDGEDKTMTAPTAKPKTARVQLEATKTDPTPNQNPVLGAAPGSADKGREEDRGGADWIGGGPPQTGGAGDGDSGSSVGIGELRARVDWLADSLNGRLDKIDAQVANVGARTPSMAERFWLGLLKWATLGLLVWAFVRFEVGDQIVKYYGIAKAKVVEMTSAGKTKELSLDPEGGEAKPNPNVQDATTGGSDGRQDKADGAPIPAPSPEKAAPSVEKAQPQPKAQAKPDADAPPRPAPSTIPAPVKPKPAEADKPKAQPKPEPKPKAATKPLPSHPVGPKPEPKPKPKAEPKPAPKAAAKPGASTDSDDEKPKPKAAVGGKGDPEKTKAKQRRQRKGENPSEAAKPEVKGL